MRVTEYLKELIKNGSGHSSKSFFLVAVTLMGCFLLLIVGFILVYEVIVNKSIKTDLMGLSAFVGAITALFASAGVTKCLSEKNENKNRIRKQKRNRTGSHYNHRLFMSYKRCQN